jgi:hypothetical protein
MWGHLTSSVRFAYFAIKKSGDPAVDILTLLVVSGQGLADVVVFGKSV